MMTKEDDGADRFLKACQSRVDEVEHSRLGTRRDQSLLAFYENDLEARRALRIALLVALLNGIAVCVWALIAFT